MNNSNRRGFIGMMVAFVAVVAGLLQKRQGGSKRQDTDPMFYRSSSKGNDHNKHYPGFCYGSKECRRRAYQMSIGMLNEPNGVASYSEQRKLQERRRVN